MVAHDGVSIVLITYNDMAHLPAAVESALAQGDVVREVVVVDDASTDETPQVLSRWPRDKVRVVRRTVNSGGCGAPRNDGTAFAQSPWIMYLDSDDVLPPGAVAALHKAAVAGDVDFAAGLCVRRELPEGREVPWQPQLFTEAGVFSAALRPETLWDTLSVNKLYRRAFLDRNKIQFADDDAHYEDFGFTAEVYAAATRFAVIPDRVYTWNVRRKAAVQSISLRRDELRNWRDRLAAHSRVTATMRETGTQKLVEASERKFLEHDLLLYLRDLHRRPAEYRQGWWTAAREHLMGFERASVMGATATARWAASVVALREEPTGLERLAELAADPPRLTPPYAGTAAEPLWDDSPPGIALSGFAGLTTGRLPINIEAQVAVAGHRMTLDLYIADLYGRLARAGLRGCDIVLRDRLGRFERERPATLGQDADGILRARAVVDGAALRGTDVFSTWDVWARLSFDDGAISTVRVRAAGGAGLGRHLVPDLRRAVLLVQPYRTANHSLAVRVADGPRGAAAVASARFRRRGAPKKS
ncbi:glycosyltransferase family 2 protein [Embleya sp. NPDC050493]|uniref:glycosyltransferase family 2 protein n=1 Tax=Embleya sp. NPDC050493 TaxID=3363989 RepID=UPI00378AB8C5